MSHSHHHADHADHAEPEFSGLKGRFFAWLLTSPLRKLFSWRMGNPDDRLMELLDLDGSETVIDSGCGSGHHSLMVAERLTTGRVVGLDVSEEMLARFRRNAKRRSLVEKAEPVLADGMDIPLEDETADRAMTVATWHHLKDPQKACAELARVLRPGGKLVAVDLLVEAGTAPMPGHDQPFGEADMQTILSNAALTNIEIETIAQWVIGTATKPPA